MFSLFHINEFPLIYPIRYQLCPVPDDLPMRSVQGIKSSPTIMLKPEDGWPKDRWSIRGWLGKGPLTDPGMADPAVPVRIEAVPGFAGVWSGDRKSRRRPGEPGEPDFPCRWASGRGAPTQNVICYILSVIRFLLRPSLSQGCEAEDWRLLR